MATGNGSVKPFRQLPAKTLRELTLLPIGPWTIVAQLREISDLGARQVSQLPETILR
jgi:hypothetical protein